MNGYCDPVIAEVRRCGGLQQAPSSLSDLWIFAPKLTQKSRLMGSCGSLQGKNVLNVRF
jgi:hypothetical protein